MAIPHFKKDGNLLVLKITEDIKDDMFKQICRELEKAAVKGPVRLILVVRHYASFNSAEDLYYNLRFVKLFADRIKKVAVVADKAWKQTWVALFGLFSGVFMEFFHASQIQEAVDWVNSD
jgi:hypothetical protein